MIVTYRRDCNTDCNTDWNTDCNTDGYYLAFCPWLGAWFIHDIIYLVAVISAKNSYYYRISTDLIKLVIYIMIYNIYSINVSLHIPTMDFIFFCHRTCVLSMSRLAEMLTAAKNSIEASIEALSTIEKEKRVLHCSPITPLIIGLTSWLTLQ